MASFPFDSTNVDDEQDVRSSDSSAIDAPTAASYDDSPITTATMIHSDDPIACNFRHSDEPVVATPIACPPASSESLLLLNESYHCIYQTRPPLSVIDLDYTEYYPCDDSTCPYVGPGGFNCPHCPVGIFNTAFVLCHHCPIGYGFLGDVCSHCQHPLWGPHVLPTSLPSQRLIKYVEEDAACIEYIPKNPVRSSYLLVDSMYVPLPSMNWAPCTPSICVDMETDTS
jgi:hypothetical protein